MPLVSYIFNDDFGQNKAGEVVSLEPEQAQALVDCGLLAEATAEDLGGPKDEEPEVAETPADVPAKEAALQRAIADGFSKLQSTLAKGTQKAKIAAPALSIGNHAQPKQPVFKRMSDLCRAVYKAKQGDNRSRNMLAAHMSDLRLKAPAGANETTAAQGGYAVIPEWADQIFSKVKNLPRLLDMCDKQTISGNTLNIPAINETSLADGSRGGGILSYYVSEGNVATTSYPQMTQIQAVLNTLVTIIPITNQLLEDNAYNLDSFLQEKVGEEITWQEDYAVLQGSGTGQPKGILNQAALVTVAKESGQAAASVVFPNLAKMWATLYPASRGNAVWLINPQVYQQLVQMTFPNASGTYPAFGFVSWDAHEEFPLKIFGRPALECLMTADLGLPGDILLADLKQLTCAEHPGLQVDVSDQVYFTSLQTLFRFVRRYDIRSPWTAALTDFNGHYTYSPFVALQSRGT